jgi:hypothetical protein
MTQEVKIENITRSRLKTGLLVIFTIAAFLSAYVAYSKSHDFFVSYDLTQIEGFAIKENPADNPPNVEGTPAPSSELPPPVTGPIAKPWDGASRVTMLVMGLDYRDWASGDGPPRTDTMILLTVDPLSRSAGMLNIPRDLWVSIPGFENSRINTAYAYAFEKFVDLLGGVLVDVQEEIKIDPIGRYNTTVLQPGEQRLQGPVAGLCTCSRDRRR